MLEENPSKHKIIVGSGGVTDDDFAHNLAEKIAKIADKTHAGMFGPPPGWYAIVAACDEQLSYLDPDYTVVQVKEKFGSLRYYCSTSIDDIPWKIFHRIIDSYEHLSSRTCEVCGYYGEQRGGSWVRTLCDKHAPGSSEKEVDNPE